MSFKKLPGYSYLDQHHTLIYFQNSFTVRLSTKFVAKPPGRVQSIAIFISVCLSCLSSRMSHKLHIQTSPNFLYVLAVAVAWSPSDDNAICWVFPVLWMMSHFHIMGQIQIQVWSLRHNKFFTVTYQVALGSKVCC